MKLSIAFILSVSASFFALVRTFATGSAGTALECQLFESYGTNGTGCTEDATTLLQHTVTTMHTAFGREQERNVHSKHGFGAVAPEPHSGFVHISAVVAAAVLTVFLLLSVRMLHDGTQPFGQPLAKGDDGRLHLLDNAKLLCVAMVIFHHSSICLKWSWQKPLVAFAHPLHISTLCFMSGLVSRSSVKVDKLMIFIVVPLIAYCSIILPLMSIIGARPVPVGSPITELFRAGGLAQWYLLALIWWRILGALLSPLVAPVRICAAFAIGAMACYFSTPVLSMTKSLCMLPIFVAGQLFPWEQALARLKWRPSTAILAALLILMTQTTRNHVAFIYSALQPADWGSLHDAPISPMVAPLLWLSGAAGTLLEILKSIVFLLFVCPREYSFLTAAGRYSLYPYLLHWPALRTLEITCQWASHRWHNDWTYFGDWHVAMAVLQVLAMASLCIWCIVVCVLLASKPVRVIFGALLEPTWLERLYVKGDEESHSSASKEAAT